MKRISLFLVTTFALAALIHVAAVAALPGFIMGKAMVKIGGTGTTNAFIEPPLATAEARGVVRPSPDLAYSVCVLDLTKGPVHIEVPLSQPYTSLALYTSQTDNYFVRNDLEAGDKPIALIVAAPGTPRPADIPAGTEFVEAPTLKSLALVRRVVEDKAAFASIDAIRKRSVCAPVRG